MWLGWGILGPSLAAKRGRCPPAEKSCCKKAIFSTLVKSSRPGAHWNVGTAGKFEILKGTPLDRSLKRRPLFGIVFKGFMKMSYT
jgi:hypothetical protein